LILFFLVFNPGDLYYLGYKKVTTTTITPSGTYLPRVKKFLKTKQTIIIIIIIITRRFENLKKRQKRKT